MAGKGQTIHRQLWLYSLKKQLSFKTFLVHLVVFNKIWAVPFPAVLAVRGKSHLIALFASVTPLSLACASFLQVPVIRRPC